MRPAPVYRYLNDDQLVAGLRCARGESVPALANEYGCCTDIIRRWALDAVIQTFSLSTDEVVAELRKPNVGSVRAARILLQRHERKNWI